MVKDWRQNPPKYLLLERDDEGAGLPIVVFESMERKEVVAESGRLVKERPLSVFKIQTRTEK